MFVGSRHRVVIRGHNNVQRGELPDLIASVHMALAKLGGAAEPAPVAAPLVPAVSIRKSVTPESIICLEDGKSVRSLKRHLRSKYDLTPEQYRTKWGLPADYPVVAAAYAEERSALRKPMGLGRKVCLSQSKKESRLKTSAPFSCSAA